MRFIILVLMCSFTTNMLSQVGVNTSDPTETLDVNGNLRLRGAVKDNNNGPGLTGQVLKSNGNGVIWANDNDAGLAIAGNIGTTFVDPIINQPTYTGATITLPPGKWQVTVTMLAALLTGTNGTRTLVLDEAYWIRTSFSDSNTVSTPSADFIGSNLYSGPITGPQRFGLVYGALILNNTSGANKTYYYWTQNCDSYGSNSNGANRLVNFGSTAWGENQIIASPIR